MKRKEKTNLLRPSVNKQMRNAFGKGESFRALGGTGCLARHPVFYWGRNGAASAAVSLAHPSPRRATVNFNMASSPFPHGDACLSPQSRSPDADAVADADADVAVDRRALNA